MGEAYLIEHYRLLVIFNVANSITQVTLYHILQNQQRQVADIIHVLVGNWMNSCSMPAENEVHCHVPPRFRIRAKKKNWEDSLELIKATVILLN